MLVGRASSCCSCRQCMTSCGQCIKLCYAACCGCEMDCCGLQQGQSSCSGGAAAVLLCCTLHWQLQRKRVLAARAHQLLCSSVLHTAALRSPTIFCMCGTVALALMCGAVLQAHVMRPTNLITSRRSAVGCSSWPSAACVRADVGVVGSALSVRGWVQTLECPELNPSPYGNPVSC